MASESIDGLDHHHWWQERQDVRILQCVECEAWRLQIDATLGAVSLEQQLAQAQAVMYQFAWYLEVTTQLLQTHELSAEEAQQCQENQAFLARQASSRPPPSAERQTHSRPDA